MPVTPAAAERSAGGTSAIVYAWRVGTSIWEMLKRKSRTAMASGRLGMSGTKNRSTLEGKWVTTMVASSPIRRATHDAVSADSPARTFAPKKMAPSTLGETPKRFWNQYATKD